MQVSSRIKQTVLIICLFIFLPLLIAAALPVPDIIVKGKPWYDVRAYMNWATAVSAIGTTEATVYVLRTETISANSTPPSTMDIQVLGGGSFSVSPGIVLNLSNCYLTAATRQIFFGSGFVTPPKNSSKLEWFGTLANASSMLSTFSTILTVESNIAVSTSISMPDTIGWDLQSNGRFTVATAQTLTLSGPFSAIPGKQVFYGNGNVLLSSSQPLLCDWWPSFAKAVTDIGNNTRQLQVYSPETISETLVIGANINLQITQGGMLSPATSTILSLYNAPEAGRYQVFGGFGTILFTSGVTVYPEWWANSELAPAAYALKATGGKVSLLGKSYTVTAHTITETTLPSIAGVHLWPGTVIEGVVQGGAHITSGGLVDHGTIIKLAGAQNCPVVKSWNFDDLDGTGTWLVSASVPTDLGLRNLTIDGNKAANTGADGVQIYAKSPVLSGQIIIHDCSGNGLVMEGGSVTGNEGYQDSIQGDIGNITTCYNTGDGIQYKGPHDLFVQGINSYKNDGYGFWSAKASTDGEDEYAGKIEVSWMHTFGNTLGIRIDTAFSCDTVTFEDFVVFPGTSSWTKIRINSLDISAMSPLGIGGGIFTNNQDNLQIGQFNLVARYRADSTPAYVFLNTGEDCQFGNIHIFAGKIAYDSVGSPQQINPTEGLVVFRPESALEGANQGVRNYIGSLNVEGTNILGSNSVGVLVESPFTRIMGGGVQRCLGANGIGFQLGNSTNEVNGCDIHLDTRNNSYGFFYAKQGNDNRLSSHIFTGIGQVARYAGYVEPSTTDQFYVYEFSTDFVDTLIYNTPGAFTKGATVADAIGTTTALTDSTGGGTASRTLSAVTNDWVASYAIVNNNFARVSATVNEVKAEADSCRNTINIIIDRLQAAGIIE